MGVDGMYFFFMHCFAFLIKVTADDGLAFCLLGVCYGGTMQLRQRTYECNDKEIWEGKKGRKQGEMVVKRTNELRERSEGALM